MGEEGGVSPGRSSRGVGFGWIVFTVLVYLRFAVLKKTFFKDFKILLILHHSLFFCAVHARVEPHCFPPRFGVHGRGRIIVIRLKKSEVVDLLFKNNRPYLWHRYNIMDICMELLTSTHNVCCFQRHRQVEIGTSTDG